MTNKIDFLNEYSLSSSSVEIVTDESQIVEAQFQIFGKKHFCQIVWKKEKKKFFQCGKNILLLICETQFLI